MEYTFPISAGFELATSVVIGTACTGTLIVPLSKDGNWRIQQFQIFSKYLAKETSLNMEIKT